MKRSITGLLFACYFLAGSVIFPLGDFSLMRDLPGMYHSYAEVKTGEPDICDFIGDYLLHGKEIFGNNANDAQPKNPGALQFQHQPTLSIFFSKLVLHAFTYTEKILINKPIYLTSYYISEYHRDYFRPPIA